MVFKDSAVEIGIWAAVCWEQRSAPGTPQPPGSAFDLGLSNGRPIERRSVPGIHDVHSLLSAREILDMKPFCRRPRTEAVGGSPAKAANRCAHRIGRDAGAGRGSSGSVAERATDVAKRSAARRAAEGRRARRGAVRGATAYLWHAGGGHIRSCECHRVGDSRVHITPSWRSR
jgi:hypothetical protein